MEDCSRGKLIETPATYIQDYNIALSEKTFTIEGKIQLKGAQKSDQTVVLSIPELNLNQTFTSDDNGKVSFDIPVEGLEYWSPSSPKLYVSINTEKDNITDQLGFRTLSTKEIKFSSMEKRFS